MSVPNTGNKSARLPGAGSRGGEGWRDVFARHFLSRRDIYGGLLMVGVGVGAILEGLRHHIGSLTHMGAGYFPVILGVILAALGAAIAVSGALNGSGEVEVEPGETFHLPDVRGCLCIISGIISFIVLAEYAGFGPATFALVFISAMGDRTMSWKGALALACVMTSVLAGLFWYALQIPFQLVIW